MDNIIQVNLGLGDLTGLAVDALLNRGVGTDTAAANGPWYHGRLDLLKAPIEMTRETTAGAVTPADYDGHGQQQVTWHPAVRDDTDESFVRADAITFVATGHATIGSNTIHAVALYGSDSVTLIGAKDLPTPLVVNELQPIVVTLTIGAEHPTD
jgi:hypothetical protein